MQHDLLTIAKAPRRALDDIALTTWRALAAGSIAEAEASALSDAIERRRQDFRPPQASGKAAGAFSLSASDRWPKCPPRPPAAPAKRRERIERRRRLAASGPLPPALACKFTVAEIAVLRVVGDECRDKGRCERTLDELAARAGCCRSSARNALRAARQHGLVDIEERRVPGRRSLPNLVRVVSSEWMMWLRRGPRREAGDSGQESERLSDRRLIEGLPKPSRSSSGGCERRTATTTPPPSRRPWQRPKRD